MGRLIWATVKGMKGRPPHACHLLKHTLQKEELWKLQREQLLCLVLRGPSRRIKHNCGVWRRLLRNARWAFRNASAVSPAVFHVSAYTAGSNSCAPQSLLYAYYEQECRQAKISEDGPLLPTLLPYCTPSCICFTSKDVPRRKFRRRVKRKIPGESEVCCLACFYASSV